MTLNFVINAQQSIESAGRANGRILIRVYDAGKKVRLEVQDDGPACRRRRAEAVPAVLHDEAGRQGHGLGLSVSYGIIESYGGAIGYRGNDWGGATFFFELPAADPAARPRPSSSESASQTR